MFRSEAVPLKIRKKNIQVLQKKLSELCMAPNITRTLNLKELKILPLEPLIKFLNLQFIQHFIQGFLPASFNSIWLTNE